MACLKHGILLLALTLTGTGCAKLTEPPKEEPMQAEPAAEKPDPMKALAAMASAKPAEKPPEPEAKPAEPTPPPSDEKLGVKDLVVGKGAVAKLGDNVKVHYVGTLPDGKEFDASKKHGQPFEFELGAGRVIRGWDQGVAGMKVGGKRKLVIPPSLGYGARGSPPVIPPNSTLNFEIELLEVKKK
jgi:FKBP-type peptidyl-prolyl cis-trans isomerase